MPNMAARCILVTQMQRAVKLGYQMVNAYCEFGTAGAAGSLVPVGAVGVSPEAAGAAVTESAAGDVSEPAAGTAGAV